MRYKAYQTKVTDGKPFTFYGCRYCRHQSRDRFTGTVIMVLDHQMTEKQLIIGDELRINWFHYQELFDFDQVEIIQASSEEVERFAVQIGNDTDQTRSISYKNAPCLVSANCQLSENAIKVLHHILAQVDMVR